MELTRRPTAIVMNMFYTGLGIARSLGERGVPVIGLSAQRGIYGNFTRHAKIMLSPDSKHQPEKLLPYLVSLGKSLGHRGIIFPTRDHDLLFLDRYRAELAQWFSIVLPEASVLDICLNKWKTYLWASRSGVPTPKCWLLESDEGLAAILNEVTYPCVLKPVEAYHWRTGHNWQLVGARKAIPIGTRDELLAEYSGIARADKRALLQEMVSGGDDCLMIAACYHDAHSKWRAGFNIRKLVQSPEGFGTGCIVQAASHPELSRSTARLLQTMGFTGIAEVEYKWDLAKKEYQLIEINPRPWDQHRLGNSCGVDLMYLAYCEHAGMQLPAFDPKPSGQKWIAEDTFVKDALCLGYRRDPKLRALFRMAKGRRVYAIWSAADPLPFLAYVVLHFLPELATMGMHFVRSVLLKRLRLGRRLVPEQPRYGCDQKGETRV